MEFLYQNNTDIYCFLCNFILVRWSFHSCPPKKGRNSFSYFDLTACKNAFDIFLKHNFTFLRLGVFCWKTKFPPQKYDIIQNINFFFFFSLKVSLISRFWTRARFVENAESPKRARVPLGNLGGVRVFLCLREVTWPLGALLRARPGGGNMVPTSRVQRRVALHTMSTSP